MPISLESIKADPNKLLSTPEDQWFDRKSIQTPEKTLARVLVALANAEGGFLAVGVSREQGLGGFGANPKRANAVRQIALDLTEPPVPHRVHIIPCINKRGDDDELLVLVVEPSEQIHRLTDDTVLLRVGDETRALTSEQALQLSYDKGVSHFDSEILPDASLLDLDQARVDAYRDLLGSPRDVAHVLAARGLFRDHGAKKGVTWAGLLMFGVQPSRHHPNSYVRLIRYQGLVPLSGTRMNIVREERIEGSIPEIIERVREELPQYLNHLTQLTSSGRFERVSEYPETVWLEAIVNAVAHRSYASFGDHIRVRIYDDRLEVESPGRLPNLVRPDNIRTTRYSRNPRIARVLSDLGYVRELGEGVDRMFDDMAAHGLPAPEFRQGDASVVVSLFNNREARQLELLTSHLPVQLTPIVTALLERNRVTTSETMHLLQVSRPTATKYLAQLQDLGLVERMGAGPRDPRAFWRLRRRVHE